MAERQSKGGDNAGGATTIQITLDQAVLAGSCLQGFVGVQSRLVTGVADNVNGAWTETFAQTNQFAAPGNWHFPNSAAADAGTLVVTFTFSASTASTAIVTEETGVATTSPLDKEAHSSTTSSAAWNSGTIASPTTQNNTVAYGFVSSGDGSDRSFAADAGWSPLSGTGITNGHHGNATDGTDLFVARREYTSTGSYAASGTCTSGNWCSGIVIYKQVAVAAKPRLALLGVG